MRTKPGGPDGRYKWILHARDHFSKFSWTRALTSKKASEVKANPVMYLPDKFFHT